MIQDTRHSTYIVIVNRVIDRHWLIHVCNCIALGHHDNVFYSSLIDGKAAWFESYHFVIGVWNYCNFCNGFVKGSKCYPVSETIDN